MRWKICSHIIFLHLTFFTAVRSRLQDIHKKRDRSNLLYKQTTEKTSPIDYSKHNVLNTGNYHEVRARKLAYVERYEPLHTQQAALAAEQTLPAFDSNNYNQERKQSQNKIQDLKPYISSSYYRKYYMEWIAQHKYWLTGDNEDFSDGCSPGSDEFVYHPVCLNITNFETIDSMSSGTLSIPTSHLTTLHEEVNLDGSPCHYIKCMKNKVVGHSSGTNIVLNGNYKFNHEGNSLSDHDSNNNNDYKHSQWSDNKYKHQYANSSVACAPPTPDDTPDGFYIPLPVVQHNENKRHIPGQHMDMDQTLTTIGGDHSKGLNEDPSFGTITPSGGRLTSSRQEMKIPSVADVCPFYPNSSDSSYRIKNPWNGFQYKVAKLIIQGNITSTSRKSGLCKPVRGATVEVWHVDEFGIIGSMTSTHTDKRSSFRNSHMKSIIGSNNIPGGDITTNEKTTWNHRADTDIDHDGINDYYGFGGQLFTPLTQAFFDKEYLQDPLINPEETEAKGIQIRNRSGVDYCRAVVESDSIGGEFTLNTVMPGVYGAPQHFSVRVSKPGYQTLTTRFYIASDPWLDYLTDSKLNRLKKDPRVVFVNGIEEDGVMHIDLPLILQKSDSHYDISGTYTSLQNPGYISVQADDGGHFAATEIPNVRHWGSTSGRMVGGRLLGVDFRDGNGYSTGMISQEDIAFGSTEDALMIEWSNGDVWSKHTTRETRYRYLKIIFSETLRPDDEDSLMKNEIHANEVGTGNDALVINEIRFYEGGHDASANVLLKNGNIHPKQLLNGDLHNYPTEAKVWCSGTSKMQFPCYKAFDGDSTSYWSSGNVGRAGPYLHEPQFILLDLGPYTTILPTAISIICDKNDMDAHTTDMVDMKDNDNDKQYNRVLNCPRKFEIYGSETGNEYSKLYERSFLIPNDYYTKSGSNSSEPFGFFPFIYHAPKGRIEGDRCGSCDRGPNFACSFGSFDPTCASSFCGEDGKCEKEIVCLPGFYRNDNNDNISGEDGNSHHPGVAGIGSGGYGSSGSSTTNSKCIPCPPGTYNDRRGGVNVASCLPCPEGYACKEGSTTPIDFPCSKTNTYCPESTGTPLQTSFGHYVNPVINDTYRGYSYRAGYRGFAASFDGSGTGIGGERMSRMSDINIPIVYGSQTICPTGHWCQDGLLQSCKEGTYSSKLGIGYPDCEGRCKPGTYCPTGTIEPLVCPPGYYCHDGRMKKSCPLGRYGSTEGLKAPTCSGECSPGYWCGEFSTKATENPCKAGTYGSISGLTQEYCEGLCTEGYYCPEGSDNAKAISCGSNAFYCPLGSPEPIPATPGYYTIGGAIETRSAQTICEPGFYCYKGTKYPCEAGYYNNISGLEGDSHVGFHCSGVCPLGHYCPEGTSDPIPCPAGRYGEVLGLKDSTCSGACGRGHFCPAGSSIKFQTPCPGGTFGAIEGIGSPDCSVGAHGCSNSYVNSQLTVKTDPNGVISCIENHASTFQSIPSQIVLSTVGQENSNTSLCTAGYFCPPGSTSPTFMECGGSHVYCPSGSSAPLKVDEGYYSTGGATDTTNSYQLPCMTGHYCVEGVMRKCPAGRYGSDTKLTSPDCSGLCELGHWCNAGSTTATENKCSGGRYGNSTGLMSSSCSGKCEQGYACPPGSTSSTEVECGHAYEGTEITNMLFDAVYCPTGSETPVRVKPGYYTVGSNIKPNRYPYSAETATLPMSMVYEKSDDLGVKAYFQGNTTRTNQVACEPGYYCDPRWGVKQPCPAGTYGISSHLKSPLCSGVCPRGFYCPEGTVDPKDFPCPIGTSGHMKGSTNSSCSGLCPMNTDCLLASTHPYDRVLLK